MRSNRLRQKLNAGEPTIGTHILSSWPTLVELIGDAENYDYVEFTAEYAPFTMHDLDNLGRAFELKNLAGMIKIEQRQYTHQAKLAIYRASRACCSPTSNGRRRRVVRSGSARGNSGSGGRLGVGMRRDVGTVLEGARRLMSTR